MAEKVTTMRLNVDLQCEECYKKVKKVLCQFPREIRDQEFDEKKNIVTIKVVCCNPEKMRDKLCCKGCGAIKSIEIVEPPPSPPPKPKPKPQPQPQPQPPHVVCCVPCSQGRPCCRPPPPPPHPVCCVPCSQGRPCGLCWPPPPPRPVCCVSCSEGRPGGPCFECCWAPPPWYEGYFYARPVYGGGRPCYVSCFNEDNATGCTIM